MPAFMEDLRDGGRVRVSAAEEWGESDDVLRDLDAEDRLHAPGELPPLDLAAARWGAAALHRACVLLAERNLPESKIDFGRPPANPESPSVVHSVDLALRHLPELHRMAAAASPDDPLVAALLDLAADWPYSSVGIALKEAPAPGRWWDHPALRRRYVDRVLARSARDRLAEPRVKDAVAAAIGDHPDLLPFPEFLRPEASA
jgi:hypothetical protein